MVKIYILKTIALLTFFIEVLPLVSCLFFLKKNKQGFLKVFFIYSLVLASFAIFSIFFLYGVQSKSAYIFLLRIYVPFEYIMLIYFFYLLFKNTIAKRLILVSILPFLSFCIYRFLTSTSNAFDSYPSLVEFFIFILILLYFFFEKMRIVSVIPVYQSISFWLAVGLFVYFTGNFFFLLLVNSSKNIEFIKQMNIVNSIVSITKDIILALAWFAHERTETDADILTIPDGLGLDDDLPYNPPTNS